MAAYASERRDGVWSRARNLGEPVNSRYFEIGPRFSPDERTFFFSSTRRAGPPPAGERPKTARNGLGDIYRIDVLALGLPAPPAR